MDGSDDDLFGAEHVRAYRQSGGERGYHWRGTAILLLTTTGARTGRSTTVPLAFAVDDNGRVFVMASKAGAPRHPAWYHNVQANPSVTVVAESEKIKTYRVALWRKALRKDIGANHDLARQYLIAIVLAGHARQINDTTFRGMWERLTEEKPPVTL